MHTLPRRPLIETLLSGGFRLFFPANALVAALLVALWVPWYLGFLDIPSALPPLAWHQHELLFGFVPGVVAGFLLTAVPNWTGRPAIAGRSLLFLFLLWLAGRAAIALSGWIGMVIALPVVLAFLPVFTLMIGRELAAAGNRRNYKILVILVVLSLAQVVFHWEVQHFGDALIGTRLALATIILMISLVAGRIVPTFTGNWLKANNPGRLPIPFSRFDVAVVLLSLVTLLAWIGQARSSIDVTMPVGVLMLAAGFAHIARQIRWCPERTLREPLLWILHLGYVFVPSGFLLMGSALLIDDAGLATAGTHAWTAGAIGVMTLAVMTRATRGHSGQALHAPWTTTWLIYVLAILSTLGRIAAAILPVDATVLLSLSGLAWVAAFLGFTVLYGPMVMGRHGS
jgi:uncharacterized protein involved in response to NO